MLIDFEFFNSHANKNNIIPASINVSFQMDSNPTPFIITSFTIR